MAVMSVEELYEKYIKRRSPEERLRLVELTAHDLANSESVILAETKNRERSLLELEGLGQRYGKASMHRNMSISYVTSGTIAYDISGYCSCRHHKTGI